MFPVFLIVLSLMPACSVKEDRTSCPCILTLDFIYPEGIEFGVVDLWVTSSDGFIWKDKVDVSMNADGYHVSVPYETLHVRAGIGLEGLESDDGLFIPKGRDCPRVYMHDSDVVPDEESCRETVVLRKNHCVMTLMVEGVESMSSTMRLRGNVAGYDVIGRPLPGDFDFLLDNDGAGDVYQAVLPRQIDDTLVLEIDDGSGIHKSFALGRYIASSGYDWSLPDLEDISVTIDYALTEIRLVVSGWESVYGYDVEI